MMHGTQAASDQLISPAAAEDDSSAISFLDEDEHLIRAGTAYWHRRSWTLKYVKLRTSSAKYGLTNSEKFSTMRFSNTDWAACKVGSVSTEGSVKRNRKSRRLFSGLRIKIIIKNHNLKYQFTIYWLYMLPIAFHIINFRKMNNKQGCVWLTRWFFEGTSMRKNLAF